MKLEWCREADVKLKLDEDISLIEIKSKDQVFDISEIKDGGLCITVFGPIEVTQIGNNAIFVEQKRKEKLCKQDVG